MNDWMANGCRLGWLIDLTNQTATVYRPNQAPEEITGAEQLLGEDILPGFVLDLTSFL